MQDVQQVGRTQRKRNALDSFFLDLERVDPNDFAAPVDQRTTAIAGIDDGVRLNPGTRPVERGFSDSIDDSPGDAEKQPVARIANRYDRFALVNAVNIGQLEMGKLGRSPQRNLL